MRPISFPRQLDIIDDHLRDAVDKGAQIIAGGNKQGMFVEPTVLLNVNHEMKIMREETFGPTMPIMKVKDEAEAIERANDSEYGLCSYVWSQDLARAERVGRQLEAGTIVTNDAMAHYAVSQLPFGGMKKSGNGRIHGPDEILQFTQLKGYAIGPAPLPFDVATVLRQPNRYKEMKALLKLVFGSWRQKAEVVTTDLETAKPTTPPTDHQPAVATGIAAAGVAAAALTIVFGLLKWSKR